jgi:Ulp1 family protease
VQHWSVAVVRVAPGGVARARLYDSLDNMNVRSAMAALCLLQTHVMPDLIVRVEAVRACSMLAQQADASTCGIYAVLFVYAALRHPDALSVVVADGYGAGGARRWHDALLRELCCDNDAR